MEVKFVGTVQSLKTAIHENSFYTLLHQLLNKYEMEIAPTEGIGDYQLYSVMKSYFNENLSKNGKV